MKLSPATPEIVCYRNTPEQRALPITKPPLPDRKKPSKECNLCHKICRYTTICDECREVTAKMIHQ